MTERCGLSNRSGGAFWICVLSKGHEGPCDFSDRRGSGTQPTSAEPADGTRRSAAPSSSSTSDPIPRSVEELIQALWIYSSDYDGRWRQTVDALILACQQSSTGEIARLEGAARMTRLFQQAARDDRLTDAAVRDIVRTLSVEPLTEADIQRTNKLAREHGWK